MPLTVVHRDPSAGAGCVRASCGRLRGIVRAPWWHAVLLVHLLAGAASAGFAREVGGVAAPMPFEEREVEIPVGALRLPAALFVPADGAAARRPAIVLLHGCGGLRDARGALALRHRDWAERFAGWGFVTLAPDSFTPRGPRSVCSLRERAAHPWRERSEDGYAALAVLAARPDVDPTRILVLGWSHGGSTVTGLVRPDAPGRAAGGRGFRAAVAFYPGCARPDRTRGWRTTMPLLVLHGEADDWTPAAACVELVRKASADGMPMRLVTYPDAHHGFDQPQPGVRLLPDVVNPGRPGGRGAHVGQHPQARLAAIEEVRRFVQQHAGIPAPDASAGR